MRIATTLPHCTLLPYLTTPLTGVLAILLWMHEGGLTALFASVLVPVSFLSTAGLLREIARSNAQKCSLDQQLIQSQKLAAIGELSSGIAHEINNPLAIIGQEVEWISHLVRDDAIADAREMADLKESLQEIGHQVERCRDITHKLLDFARKREPLIQTVDLNKLVEDMARLVEKEAVHHNIQIIRDYHKNLPTVHTDPPLLRQVILNLLNNATYAIHKDGTVIASTRVVTDHAVEISVKDSGCGIPQENLTKIFDPFFTTKPPGKGTGLGLSICHGIIKRLGGEITVKSDMGKGSTFTIHLPLKQRLGEV